MIGIIPLPYCPSCRACHAHGCCTLPSERDFWRTGGHGFPGGKVSGGESPGPTIQPGNTWRPPEPPRRKGVFSRLAAALREAADLMEREFE